MHKILLSIINEFERLLKAQVTEAVNAAFKNNPLTDPPTPEPEFISRKAAAKLLGVSLVTIDDWSEKGTLQSYQIESRIRFKKSQVIDAMILRKKSSRDLNNN